MRSVFALAIINENVWGLVMSALMIGVAVVGGVSEARRVKAFEAGILGHLSFLSPTSRDSELYSGPAIRSRVSHQGKHS
jgi:hypothetical protein